MSKSHRLQQLLLFISKSVLLDPDSTIREQAIGAGVFGRPASYDTGEDTIVRVHTFQLRRRLQRYFDTEGINEPMVIEIPKGSYGPVFVPRPAATPDAHPAHAFTLNRRSLALVCAAAVALVLIGCWGGWYLREAWKERGHGTADVFWQQIFDNGKSTDLVLGDASFSFIQGSPLLGRDVSLWNYQSRSLDLMFDTLADPARKDVGRELLSLFAVPFADALATHRLGVMAARNGVSLDIVFARDFSARHLDSHNVILVGTRRSNPWMAFFEDRLNFQYGFDTAGQFGYFRNVAPLPGEAPQYRVFWNQHGFSRVAYLPNLTRTGSVLILSGTDLQSVEAGARFIISDRSIDQIGDALRARSRSHPPYFEAILKTDLLMGSAPRFELVAARSQER